MPTRLGVNRLLVQYWLDTNVARPNPISKRTMMKAGALVTTAMALTNEEVMHRKTAKPAAAVLLRQGYVQPTDRLLYDCFGVQDVLHSEYEASCQ